MRRQDPVEEGEWVRIYNYPGQLFTGGKAGTDVSSYLKLLDNVRVTKNKAYSTRAETG